MCQPDSGRLTRIAQDSDADVDHAHLSRNDGKCVKSRTFVNDVLSDELCREDIELARQSSVSSDGERRRRALVTFAEAPLHCGDTLVTIALKYGCRVRV